MDTHNNVVHHKNTETMMQTLHCSTHQPGQCQSLKLQLQAGCRRDRSESVVSWCSMKSFDSHTTTKTRLKTAATTRHALPSSAA